LGLAGAAALPICGVFLLDQVPIVIRTICYTAGGLGSLPGDFVAAVFAAIIPRAASNNIFVGVAIAANAGAYAAGYLWYCEHKQRKEHLRRSRGL